MRTADPLDPLSGINRKAMRVLRRELGVVDTLRFLSQFTAGNGNYTDEREAIVGNPSVDDIFAEARRIEALFRKRYPWMIDGTGLEVAKPRDDLTCEAMYVLRRKLGVADSRRPR